MEESLEEKNSVGTGPPCRVFSKTIPLGEGSGVGSGIPPQTLHILGEGWNASALALKHPDSLSGSPGAELNGHSD